ncbi:MAG: hypothetical protein J5821_01115 [Alphaproteobacteria bacterium]|nr:hypothetical protein [Alphaproteobacteria bacterium]
MLAFFKRLGRAFKESRGVSAILVILFLPVIFAGIHYLVQYTQKSNVHTTNTGIPYGLGKAIARAFNPGKTFRDQKEYLYSIAAQVYNDGAYISGKEMALEHDKTIRIGVKTSQSQSVTSLCDFYASYCTGGRDENSTKFSTDDEMLVNYPPFANFAYDESKQKLVFSESYEGVTRNEDVVDTINKYKEDKSKLELSLNNKGNIEAKCPDLGQKAEIIMPRNDVDIIIAIPTNRASNTTTNDNAADFANYSNTSNAADTPIRQIAGACQLFLKNFLHTAGIAVGIIPYSGKVSLSPYSKGSNTTKKDSYTTKIAMNTGGPNQPYAIQAMFYGSDGKYGGDIIVHGSKGKNNDSLGDYKDWGTADVGLPIMARRGLEWNYRNMVFYSGALIDQIGSKSLLLDMTTTPTDAKSEYKFMQMNTNSCYLGFCNTLAMTCEKDCPTFMANPYFMTELTSDIQSLIYDLELFVPFKDERNKSNFLFLPIVMAGNLFSWGGHTSELSSEGGRVKESSRHNKKRVVIVIANAPDNFEPQEMTYLGFNNDYSEIPMIESDTILFNQDRGYQTAKDGDGNNIYMGVKGAVRFSTLDGSLGSQGYQFKARSKDQVMKAKISFPHKGLLKIVAERVNPATVTVYGGPDGNRVEDNVGTHTFLDSKTLTFGGPQQVYNWSDLSKDFSLGNYTTKGPNFGHNTSTKKVKIKFTGCKLSSASLSNQILRFYGTYSSSELGKSQIGGSRMDPCISFGSGEDKSNGWLNYGPYILAYGFSPNCAGVSNLSKFVMAVGGVSRRDIVDDYYVGGRNGVKHSSSGTAYRVYSGGSLPFYTGKLQIENYAYYDQYVSQKERKRTIKQIITTTRIFPDRSVEATQGTETDQTSSYNKSFCCSKRWQGYYRPYATNKVNCNSLSVKNYWNGRTEHNTDCSCGSGSCSYFNREYVSDGDCSVNLVKKYLDVPGKSEKFSYIQEAVLDCNTRTYESKWIGANCTCPAENCTCLEDKNNCLKYHSHDELVSQEEHCSCPSGYTLSDDGRCKLCWMSGDRDYKCNYESPTCEYSCPYYSKWRYSYELRQTGCIYKCQDACEEYAKIPAKGHVCSYPELKEKAIYSDINRSCETPVYHYEYNHTGYNEDPGCSGVCYNSVVTDLNGLKRVGNPSTSRKCKDGHAETIQTESFEGSQTQKTSRCDYSKGSNYSDNSICSYDSISDPKVDYSYEPCNGDTGKSEGAPAYTDWVESITEYKRFYARYLKNIDGNDAGTECFTCDKNGDCSPASCPGNKPSYSSGTYDGNKTTTSPYRYQLHNFFFVNGDNEYGGYNKYSTYSYSGSYPDYTLDSRSQISSDTDPKLRSNQGIYLLPTGNENEYWVCFCGDANLTLNFTDATEASVTFPNVDSKIQYMVDFGDSAEKTVIGNTKNDIETRQIFYIHPDQIKDTPDDDGNYYVDLNLKGQVRILSVELTNRPLKMETVKEKSIDGEIVGHDESGGKAVGNALETVTLKLPEEAAYSFTVQPISYWVEGRSDFRQDLGNVLVCSNTDKAGLYFNAAAPDSGEGTITLTAGQPTRENKRSDTGQLIEEVTPNYTYTISTDRKLKSITVPSFVAPRVEFGGAVSPRSYTFCTKEVSTDSALRLFDWPLVAFSHAQIKIGSGFDNETHDRRTYYGTPNILKFNLTACKMTQASAENLIIQFSPTVNDFSSVILSNTYGERILQGSGGCQNDLRFVDDDNYPTVCGYLDENGVDCRKGYWLPWSSCADGGYYSSHISPLPDFWDAETKIDMTSAYNQYGQGTVLLYAYRGTRPLDATFFAGASEVNYNKSEGAVGNLNVVLMGLCPSSEFAKAGMMERYRDSSYKGYNYLGACYYQATNPCDLMHSDHLSYSDQDEVNHNYKGTLSFHGIGDVRVYVQPQKVRARSNYTRNMSESEVSGSFGNYKYTFSEPDYLLNLDNESLTRGGMAFELLYKEGKASGRSIAPGRALDLYADKKNLTSDSEKNCYCSQCSVENVLVSVSSGAFSQVDGDTLSFPGQKNPEERTFTISPATHTFEKKVENGKTYYYVKLEKCKNVYISNLRAAANLLVYYAHPNIINENLINTRIIDGYDQATYRQMTLYGNMNYNNGNLPAVSAVQKLFYNVKTDDLSRYFYPRLSGASAAFEGEEGDFFIQLWDYKGEAPAVQWKIGNSIRSGTKDITVSDSGFGAFRSNYAFNGLHRMFFPYSTYNRDYAGYSYARNSAFVFAGYTLPINLILASNGYQTTYSLDSGNVSGYTRPKEALANLANDACERLKTDLANEQGEPIVLLVKYRTDSTLSLEDCADETYSASSEKELNAKLNEIAQVIKQNGQPLRVDVSDI